MSILKKEPQADLEEVASFVEKELFGSGRHLHAIQRVFILSQETLFQDLGSRRSEPPFSCFILFNLARIIERKWTQWNVYTFNLVLSTSQSTLQYKSHSPIHVHTHIVQRFSIAPITHSLQGQFGFQYLVWRSWGSNNRPSAWWTTHKPSHDLEPPHLTCTI